MACQSEVVCRSTLHFNEVRGHLHVVPISKSRETVLRNHALHLDHGKLAMLEFSGESMVKRESRHQKLRGDTREMVRWGLYGGVGVYWGHTTIVNTEGS